MLKKARRSRCGPNYHAHALTAKALSTLDVIAPGRISLNVVSSWWRDEAAQYGAPFDVHDASTPGLRSGWTSSRGCCGRRPQPHRLALRAGGHDARAEAVLLPPVYVGGESPTAKDLIAAQADAYVMHGDSPEVIADKVADVSKRRAATGRPPLQFGVSGYVICRDTEAAAQDELARALDVRSSPAAYASYRDFVEGSQLESQVSLEEYSVSNRGLRSGLIGTPDQITERLRAYEQAGVDLVLLQFSPQQAEMARFSRDVIRRWPG